MGNQLSGKSLRQGILGNVVTKALAPTTNVLNPLFTISGGLVAITALVGEVTVAIPNTASLTIKLQATPTGGAAGDLCGATTITNDALGTLYGITSGVPADLLSISNVSAIGGTPVAAGAADIPSVTFVQSLWRPLILRAGSIGVLVSNHAITPGAITWYLTYTPLGPGAAVVAV